ncbi:MAG TPA: DEAD/DEAH box helicase family protein [Spirochaetota bacterium]|nr:DEAD/DEAH box helicase family protein [Spirochaetota bacterium]HQK07386.1 DEAD/DEAH box helicase family protein [Spirochaetota bacterium]
MAIDFKRLTSSDSLNVELYPRKIFSLLPNKAKKFNYPRDVQSEVWDKWFEMKDSNNLIIKMNTGSGKTLVGLIILKSCLNEVIGPCVYIAPDLYLVEQVINEATQLGLEVTDDPHSARFKKSKSILVTSIYRLINGKSVFGVGDEGIKIEIGSIIIDDAHACISTTESQFTLNFDSNHPAYNQIFQLLIDDLKKQSEVRVLEIESNEPGKNMLVPYWAWIDNIDKISKILYLHKETDDFKFKWPLISNYLKYCRCVIGEGEIEISPINIPITMIPSIVNAKRKVFMTATLSDDNILISHFDLPPESIKNPITPLYADDVGDRMILSPQELNPNISNEDLRLFFKDLSETYNVIIIVPSNYKASLWAELSDLVLHAENLSYGVDQLNRTHVGLVIIVNKYDGIDLPKDACHILVIDDVPDLRRKFDILEQGYLIDSDYTLNRLITQIEQGMGRGIRSSDDYCLVFLMGRNLTKCLFNNNAIDKFTNATKAQIKLSEKLSEQLHNSDLTDIKDVSLKFLERDKEWIKASKEILIDLKYDKNNTINEIIIAQRKAFNSACINNYSDSIKEILSAVNSEKDMKVKGWLEYQLAEYLHFTDPIESQITLKSAIMKNNLLIRPKDGIVYSRLKTTVINQINQCLSYWNNFQKKNSLLIEFDCLLNDLIFLKETSNAFEESLKKIALFIGFNSQRPENEYGKGPDVLWEVGDLNYFVIECKNGASVDYISKEYCNQLNGSITWFENEYDSSCKCTPILIHPSNIFEFACSPNRKTRIITKDNLDELKKTIRKFIETINHNIDGSFDSEKISNMLSEYKLLPSMIINTYTSKFKVKN